MKSLFEQLGGTYTRQGDYCLPDVCLPPEEKRPIGIYGQRRRVYLRAHHRVLYYNLLTALRAARRSERKELITYSDIPRQLIEYAVFCR